MWVDRLRSVARLPVLLIVTISVTWTGPGWPASESESQRPIVVELFASQGCSACPPANEVLAELARDPRIIALTLPVDYWDYLGWKDSLAQPAFSARQRAYATARGDRHVYTPQMVMNGAVVCVGGERAAVVEALSRAAGSNSALRIAVRPREEGDQLIIDVAAGEGTADLWLLGLRRRQEVTILRGENQGRSILFRNVVRELRHIGLWTGSAVTFQVPVALTHAANSDGYVLLLQEARPSRGLGVIVGAAKGPGL